MFSKLDGDTKTRLVALERYVAYCT